MESLQGEFALTEIIETQSELIKIKTKMGNKELLTVLRKMNNSKSGDFPQTDRVEKNDH